MGRIISVTLLSHLCWGAGGYRIRIFCSVWLENFRGVFVIVVIQPLKRGGGGGGHKDLLTDH